MIMNSWRFVTVCVLFFNYWKQRFKDLITQFIIPAFKFSANSWERFVIKLSPKALKLMAVCKTIDG